MEAVFTHLPSLRRVSVYEVGHTPVGFLHDTTTDVSCTFTERHSGGGISTRMKYYISYLRYAEIKVKRSQG